MRFSAIHKLTSYLMLLSAVVALLLSPEMSTVTVVLTLSGIFLSWFAEPSRIRLERFTPLWNITTVGVFLYLITDVFRGGSVITSGACFLLFVLINKLFNRRTSKDYQQAYVIGFLILVVSTTLNTNVSYAICFALFILFATWAMALLHLRREMEENYLLRHSDGAQSEKVEVERILNSRRIVGRSFLVGTSMVSVGIIVIATLIFTFFPRIGFGLFLGHRRGGVSMVGFSERVELGHHGVIRDNPQVVMRVVFPGGRPRGHLRWRGSAFDHYEDGTWSHGQDLIGRTRALQDVDRLYVVNHAPGMPIHPSPEYLRRNLVRQEIYLEPLDSTIVFGADRPVALEVQPLTVGGRLFFVPRRGPLGEIRATKMRTSGVRYAVYSRLTTPAAAVLRSSRTIQDPRWSRFLQLPARYPARVGQLARRITAGQTSLYDRVVAIQTYLRQNYRYTLRLTHDPGLDPVDEFLFVTRRGHCEYFASAMTIILRHLGIHARNVNGFAGGEWNDLGQYMAVRQGDAHAWVEVLFDNIGWVTVDPTPAGQATAATGAAWYRRAAGQLWDTLRLRWFRYVVEYDLGKQVSLLQGIRGVLSMSSPRTGWLQRHLRLVLAVCVGLLGLAALAYWRRRRRRQTPPQGIAVTRESHQATQLYRRMLRLLARRGYAKPAGDTPLEFLDRLARNGCDPGCVLLVDRLTRWYYQLRYAMDHEPLQTQLGEFRAMVGELQRSITAPRHGATS